MGYGPMREYKCARCGDRDVFEEDLYDLLIQIDQEDYGVGPLCCSCACYLEDKLEHVWGPPSP